MKKAAFISIIFFSLLSLTEVKTKPSKLYLNFCLFLFFCHTLSAFFKSHYNEFDSFLAKIFPRIIYFTNFANIIFYLKSERFFYLFYILVLIMIFTPYVFIIIEGALKYFFEKTISNESLIKIFMKFTIKNWNWFLMIPALEILMNPFECEWYTYTEQCSSIPDIINVLSFLGIFFSIVLQLTLVYLKKNFYFLDKDVSFEGNIFRFAIFIIRDLQVLLFPLLKKSPVFFDFSIHIVAFLSFYEYFCYSSLKNQQNNEEYLKYLCSIETINILLFFWKYTTIVNNSNIFYLFPIGILLSSKIGLNFSRILIENKIILNPNNLNDSNLCALLEEIKSCEIQAKNDKKFHFNLLGYFHSHFKKRSPCNEQCDALKIEFCKDSFHFINSGVKINSFIKNKFSIYLSHKELMKNSKKKIELVMKYLDFLRTYSYNSKKILFELEKSKHRIFNEEDNSFYIRHLQMNFHGFIKEMVKKENSLLSPELKNQSVNMQSFFKMNKFKITIINEIKQLLKMKKKFWVDYYIGYKEMDTFISDVQILTMKIDNLRNLLIKRENNPITKVLVFKAFTIFESIFFNNVNKAGRYEEEYYKLYKNELIFKQNNKTKLSFLDQNIIVCEASFLNLDGKIKSNSKTKKFCEFFGYSLAEIHLKEYITDYMPDYLASKHKTFVENYFEKTISSTRVTNYPIKTYAVHKENYLIPICLYISAKYAPNDFLFVSAIVYDENSDDQFIIYNLSGEILGVSKKMMEILAENAADFKLEIFKRSNLFDFVHNLKQISESNISHDFLMNQHSILCIPSMADQNSMSSLSQTWNQKKRVFLAQSRRMTRFAIDFILKINKYHNGKKGAKEIIIHMSITSICVVNEDSTLFGNDTILSSKKEGFHNREIDEENINEISIISKREQPNILLIKKKDNHYYCETPKIVNTIKTLENDDKIEIKQAKSSEVSQKFIEMKKDAAVHTDDLDSKNLHIKEKNEALSQNSSVLKGKIFNSKVFSGIETIKKYVPKYFYLFFLGIFLEVMLLMIYPVYYYNSINQYFSDNFYPSQRGLILFCEQYTAFALSTAAAIELEYQRLGFLNESAQIPFYNEFYYRLIKQNFVTAKNIIFRERNYPQTLKYQYQYQNEPTLMADPNTYPLSIRTMSYFDYVEYNLNYLEAFVSADFRTINYVNLIFLQRNYPLYLIPSAKIYATIQASFLSDSSDLKNYLYNLMVVFLILMGILKIFEIVQIIFLYHVVNKLGLIFLRTNQNEAMREIKFTEKIMEEFETMDNFIYLNYVEKALCKQEKFSLFEDRKHSHLAKKSNKNALEKAKKKKKNFFHSNSNISPIKKTKGLAFIVITVVLSFSFYFFNNFYWSSVTSTIQQVISLDVGFANLYVYSTSILLCNNEYLREMLITNPEYEATKNNYQTPNGRKAYLIAAYNKRIQTVKDTFNQEIPQSVTNANKTMKDANFQLIINSDVCQGLKNLNVIQEDERKICSETWGGVFHKGIMMATNSFIQRIVEIGVLRAQIPNKTSEDYKKLIRNIQNYIADPTHQELFVGEYFLSQALLFLYDYVNEYYNAIIENEKNSSQLTLFLSMIFLEGFFILLAFFLAKYMKIYYKYLALSLSMMPFEKITEDEATSQIINNFTTRI